MFAPPQDAATELESPFLGAQAVEDHAISDDDHEEEHGGPTLPSPIAMPSPTPSVEEGGEETAPTVVEGATPSTERVEEHLEDGQGWWATNSTTHTQPKGY